MSDDTKNDPWPDEEPMIDDLYAEIDALKAALAKCWPWGNHEGECTCRICGEKIPYHLPDCLWALAKAGTE
jgi:hypothetical protein